MTAPLIHDGAVAFANGRIVDVGPAAQVSRQHPDATTEDLGDALLLPGLVNAHVHLELSDLTPGDPPPSFVDWLLGVMRNGPAPTTAGDERVAAAVQAGIVQCLRFGVTTVGDITRFPRATRRVLADSPLRAVSFGEVTAMGERRRLLEERLAAALTPSPAPARVVSAVSPHAPYSVEPGGFARCLAAASDAGVPIATHLAESADEAEFLAEHAGAFRRLWDAVGGLDEHTPRVCGGPIRLAEDVGLLGYSRLLLVHVNHASDAELRRIAAGRASVVYCPRTHAYFNHPPHPWRRMMDMGINVAVGTDSTGSSPDLNLVDDLRLLHQIAPEVPAETLWRMATVNAASALGLSGMAGSLAPGAAADFVAFRAERDNPLAEVLNNDGLPSQLWIGGSRI